MISVIVPVYNEEERLSRNSSFFKEVSDRAELIFVDAGSTDKTAEALLSLGKSLSSRKGRAHQMNFGARSAQGDILLFLHADTSISPDTLPAIEKAIKEDHLVGGGLTQKIDKEGVFFRLIENFGNTRAKLTKVFYGDQGIFVEKVHFFRIGGFPEVPVMEDVLFTKKLRRSGKTGLLGEKIMVSPRRWDKDGIFRTAVRYAFMNVLFWLKVPLQKVEKLYGDTR